MPRKAFFHEYFQYEFIFRNKKVTIGRNVHQGELAKHKYPQFQKLQEFALGTEVMFHILFKSDENNARESIFFFMNMFHMSLSLETKRFRCETWRFKKSLLTK